MIKPHDSDASRRPVKDESAGEELVKLLHDSLLRDIDMERVPTRSRVRDVDV